MKNTRQLIQYNIYIYINIIYRLFFGKPFSHNVHKTNWPLEFSCNPSGASLSALQHVLMLSRDLPSGQSFIPDLGMLAVFVKSMWPHGQRKPRPMVFGWLVWKWENGGMLCFWWCLELVGRCLSSLKNVS